MNETVFQNLYDELSKYLIPGWEKLVVYLEYGVASYSFSFYVKNNGEYIKCYDLPDVSDNELANSFKVIDEFIAPERSENIGMWSNMTMIVDNNGNMHTDYDYTDFLNGSYQYKKSWKKKYLV